MHSGPGRRSAGACAMAAQHQVERTLDTADVGSGRRLAEQQPPEEVGDRRPPRRRRTRAGPVRRPSRPTSDARSARRLGVVMGELADDRAERELQHHRVADGGHSRPGAGTRRAAAPGARRLAAEERLDELRPDRLRAPSRSSTASTRESSANASSSARRSRRRRPRRTPAAATASAAGTRRGSSDRQRVARPGSHRSSRADVPTPASSGSSSDPQPSAARQSASRTSEARLFGRLARGATAVRARARREPRANVVSV